MLMSSSSKVRRAVLPMPISNMSRISEPLCVFASSRERSSASLLPRASARQHLYFLARALVSIFTSSRERSSAGVVIRRLDGHRDVVRMAFLQARRGDLHELRLLQL